MTSILVVGERARIDEELVEALEHDGLEVERIRDAMSAIAYLDRNRAEVVLAASELPEWSGLRLLRHVESNEPDIATFLVVETGSREMTRAQRAEVTPLVADGSNWTDLADIVGDRLFEGQVRDHRDRRHHLAIATATVLLDALDSLKRASTYRKSTHLLRETAIMSTREVVEESVCRELAGVPGYGSVWVNHYYPDREELVPQAASGMEIGQLQAQSADVYAEAGIDLSSGEVAVRKGTDHTEVVIPLRNDEHTHGTIHIQAGDAAVSSFEREQLGNLGRIVGRFITALEKLQEIAESLESADEAEVEQADQTEPSSDGTEPAGGTAEGKSDNATPSTTDEHESESGTSEAEQNPAEALAEIERVETARDEPESLGLEEEDADEEPNDEVEDSSAELVRGGAATEAVEAGTSEPETPDTPNSPVEAEGDSMSPLVAYSDTIAHELRNHINVAEAFLDLGRTKGDEENFERVEQALDRIERLTDEAAAVASDSIDSDQMGQGELRDAAEIAWERVEAEEAELTVETDLSLKADHGLLELLLENLFRNAADHVGRDVHLWVGPLADEDGFFVEDDGPGIPESERERLFGWGESGGDSDGGIGLAIVERIAENHGWSIDIEDGREGGARFEISNVDVLS